MKDFFNRPWVYRVIALGLAVLLFIYVQSSNLGSTVSSKSGEQQAIADTKVTMSVDLEVKSDTTKYYITGYPRKVSITVEGSSALVAAVQNTRGFQAYIDLRSKTVGTHTVKVKVSGLNKTLTYSIKPETVKVKIQNRSDKTLPIQVKYKDSRVADGYLVGTPQISPETVRISGSKAAVARVKQVVAQLDLSANVKENYTQEVMLEALDASGNVVDVLVTPQTAHVELPIYLPTKKMALNFKQSGTGIDGKIYAFSSSVTEVTVSAPQSILSKLGSSLDVSINVNKLSSTTQKTITLSKPEGVIAISPASISVNVTVKQDTSTSESDSSSSSSSKSSSSSSNSASDESSSSSSSTTSTED